MSNDGHRIRVERLLRGEFEPYDVAKLFLFLRLQPHCGANVAEIGNFESHAGDRNQGVSTDATEEFFAFIRFRWPHIAGKPIELDNLPLIFPAAMRGNFKRIDDRYIKKKTHLSRSAARKALESFLGKMILGPKNRMSVRLPMDQTEWSVCECVMNRLTVHPAFNDRDLFREFCDILVRCGLLANKEKAALRVIRKGLTLYAVALMHRCVIRLSDGTSGRLTIVPTIKGVLDISAGYKVPSATDPTKEIEIITALFATELKLADCFEAQLAGVKLADTNVEVTAQQTLKLLA